MNDVSKKIMTTNDAALRLGLSKSTLAKMRLSGKGPKYIKLGRRVGYLQSDIDQWIQSNKFQSTSEYDLIENRTA